MQKIEMLLTTKEAEIFLKNASRCMATLLTAEEKWEVILPQISDGTLEKSHIEDLFWFDNYPYDGTNQDQIIEIVDYDLIVTTHGGVTIEIGTFEFGSSFFILKVDFGRDSSHLAMELLSVFGHNDRVENGDICDAFISYHRSEAEKIEKEVAFSRKTNQKTTPPA